MAPLGDQKCYHFTEMASKGSKYDLLRTQTLRVISRKFLSSPWENCFFLMGLGKEPIQGILHVVGWQPVKSPGVSMVIGAQCCNGTIISLLQWHYSGDCGENECQGLLWLVKKLSLSLPPLVPFLSAQMCHGLIFVILHLQQGYCRSELCE